MQKAIKIKTKDGYAISGTLNRPSEPVNRLVIFVHGLFGRQNDHFFFNARRFFEEQSFATFSFDFYGSTTGARKFEETAISVYTQDLDRIVRHLSSTYPEIHLVGHSLGATPVLLSNLVPITSIVLWDPSRNAKDIFQGLNYNSCLKAYLFEHTYKTIVSERIVADLNNLPLIQEIIQRIKKPVKIITAGKGASHYGKELYFNRANNPKCFFNIRRASHFFDEEGVEQILFRETLVWLEKYSVTN